MIDTITLILSPKPEAFNYEVLENQTSSINDTGEIIIGTGSLKNLQVKDFSNRIMISGSLTKYALNNNYCNPTYEEIQNALLEISKELRFNLDDARVTRLDVAYNFLLKHPVKKYLLQFGGLKFHKTANWDNSETLMYKTKHRKIVFYHKLLEMKSKREKVPDELIASVNKYLRYEIQLTKKIHEEFGVSTVTANMLLDPKFFQKIIDVWKKYYFQIHKTNKGRFRNLVFDAPTRLKNSLAAQGLQKIGFEEVLKMINAEKSELGPKKTTRLKKMIKELSIDTDATVSYPLITELDSLIEDVCNNYLQEH